uniref:50S ribosomal protein L16 n=1 Tax=Lotharella vacuolata TaxID=74820 RepID=A0A140JZS9_9EUKA|nr:50S ribosomal protein L16 [Lotharella vacuolata]BAU62606.1 50S ribosomal protein L16 [Lotharella vacuolata]
MLSPKRTKFKRYHRLKINNEKPTLEGKLAFGMFGLKALNSSWIRARQIEAGRRAITRYLRRGGKIWIRIFPDKPITFRPQETRMGSGKGSTEFWVAIVKCGSILYEISGVSEVSARGAMRIASFKLPVKTKFIKKIVIE